MKRIVVVGAGLAGLVTSTALAKDGFDVTCVAFGVGGLPLSPDVVESAPSSCAERSVVAGSELAHPYAAIGSDAIQTGLELLLELAGSDLLTGGPETSVMLPTALGGWRPACLYPPSMAAGASDGPAVIVGLRGLRDFYPGLIAGNWGGRAAMVDVAPRTGEATSSPLVFARFFDTDEGRRALVKALRPVVQNGETVGLPAVLGLDDVNAWRKIEDALGQPVFEIPMAPPSVPGWRLNNALVSAAQAAGVRFRRGVKAIGVQQADGRATGLVVASAGHPTTLPADAVVLASGGLKSGGIVMGDHQQFHEPVMGLPLANVPEAPFVADVFAPQPAYLVGVRVDEAMHPLDSDGNIVCSNVHAVGGLLGGSDRSRELTSGGIDVGSAVAAAEAIGGELA
ncbi:MAG: glycerol-3-phosphate dehydrogenase subunit GlpB [Propionibacteriaceae bacterium]|nr:glycerol-3-phosphate dehydrogenase subunit GlpB [Propionibacteriaceae bacterium]